MAIEIVSIPMKNGGSFHSYVTVYQRVMIPNDQYVDAWNRHSISAAWIRRSRKDSRPSKSFHCGITPFMVYLCVCVHIYYEYLWILYNYIYIIYINIYKHIRWFLASWFDGPCWLWPTGNYFKWSFLVLGSHGDFPSQRSPSNHRFLTCYMFADC